MAFSTLNSSSTNGILIERIRFLELLECLEVAVVVMIARNRIMVCTSWINLYMYTYREYFTHPLSVKDVLKHGVLTVDLA